MAFSRGESMDATVFGLPVLTMVVIVAVPLVIVAGLIVWGVKFKQTAHNPEAAKASERKGDS
jgi:hypothetical protein